MEELERTSDEMEEEMKKLDGLSADERLFSLLRSLEEDVPARGPPPPTHHHRARPAGRLDRAGPVCHRYR